MSTLCRDVLHQGRVAEYDAIADRYDGFFADEDSHNENLEVFNRLAFCGSGHVLDIGCGTGLFLDYAGCETYVGIDPSAKMLERFLQAHPARPGLVRLNLKFEEFRPLDRFDLIVLLFGSANYIEPESFGRVFSMLLPGGRVFAMFYQDGYVPVTYQRSGRTFRHFDTEKYDLAQFRISRHRDSYLIAEFQLKA